MSPIPGIYPKELKTYIHTKIYTKMFTAVFFLKAKKRKEPKCPLTAE